MKDALWVFKSFGLKAGVLFVVGTLSTRLKRLTGISKKPKRFDELSDEEARKIALALGVNPFQTRDQLNNEVEDNLNSRTLH